MPKNSAQHERRSNSSASRTQSRISKDQKATQGTKISPASAHSSHPDPEASRSRAKDTVRDADPLNTSKSSHSEGITPKTQRSLAVSGNDAFIQGKGRDVIPLETASADSLDGQPQSDHATDQNCSVSRPPSGRNDHIDPDSVYLNREPISVGSFSGTRREANGVHGLPPDQEPAVSIIQETSQGPLENLHRSEGAWHHPEAFGALPAPLSGFVADVANDDGRRCARFLNNETDAVNKPLVASILRQAAISGMTTGDKLLADSCIKALGVISFCRNSPREQATKLFTTMVLRNDDEVAQMFQRVVEEERRLCHVLSVTSHPTDQHTKLQYVHDPSSTEKKDQKRKESPESETLHKLIWGSPLMGKQHIIGEMFQKKESQFFRPGSMFKTLEYEVIVAGSSQPEGPEQSRHKVVPNILCYISVKVGENYCLALRAKTYGGLGLSMPSHVSANIESHAVIYDTEPRLLPGEPVKLKEQAIKVCLATGVHDLDPAMRLDLGRVYTVEYTVRAQEVGEVAEPTHLIAEWKKQMVGEG